MKTLIVLFLGVYLYGFGIGDNTQLEKTMVDRSTVQEVKAVEDYCKLTLTGYANFTDIRLKVTFSAEAETCEEAAAEMREKIIEQEIRIAY